jgi:hypothetical protein
VSATRLTGAAIDSDINCECLHEWAVSTQCGQGSPADSDDAHRRCPSLPCGLLTRFIRRNQHPANGSPSLAPIWPGISELPRCQTPSAVVACRVDAIMSVPFAPLIAASRQTAIIGNRSAISSRLHPSVHMPACLLLHHQMIRCGRLQSANNNNTGRSGACSSSENNRLCQQFQAPQCSTTAEQQTVFAATEDLVSLVCSVIDYVTTHMEGYQLAREFGLPLIEWTSSDLAVHTTNPTHWCK